MMDIDPDRMLKSHDLYKDELCKDCFERLSNACAPYEGKNVRKGFRTYAKYLKDIGVWQKGLCNDCYKKLFSKMKASDNEEELQGIAKRFHDKR